MLDIKYLKINIKKGVRVGWEGGRGGEMSLVQLWIKYNARVAVLAVMGHCLSHQVPDLRPLQATVLGEADPLLQVWERLALTRAVRRAGLLLREL